MGNTGGTDSVIAVAIDDVDVQGAMVDALERRYGSDYDVAGVGTAAALELLGELAPSGRTLSLLLAPVDHAGLAVLREVRAHFPTARRIAVIEVGDTSVAEALGRAMTLDHVDYFVGQPWATPEEELYPVTGEALRVWSHDQQLRYDKLTIVDEPTSDRGRALASWLNGNSVAATAHSSDSSAGKELLAGALRGVALPAALLYDGRVLSDPADDELAEALGARTRPSDECHDVTIVGGGPAGLAAAVYAAAEGLRTLVIEQRSLGGQAGTSTKIRNYLGFRWGISGNDLAAGASRQAEQLGTEFVVTRAATGLRTEGDEVLVQLDSGDVARSRTVILAGGVAYRRLGVASVDRLVGAGVFYGAGASEAASMHGLRVGVLGAGNSAGQAAGALAKAGADVTMIVRGESLATSMSDYLVQQVSSTPNIAVRCGTQIADAIGDRRLEGLVLQEESGTADIDLDALFVFIGARPHTAWLDGTVTLDHSGFILTGRDLPEGQRPPWLQTNLPGVFAAGDIRFGSIKRVAAAVGEGSTATMLALEHLDSPRELPA